MLAREALIESRPEERGGVPARERPRESAGGIAGGCLSRVVRGGVSFREAPRPRWSVGAFMLTLRTC